MTVIADSNVWDLAIGVAAAVPAIIGALFAYFATRSARAAHREVKSPNGTTTGVQAYEMAKRQKHMQVTQAEINELALNVKAELHDVRNEQRRVESVLEEHTRTDNENFQSLRDTLHVVIQNQEYIKQRGEEMTQAVAERLDIEPPNA